MATPLKPFYTPEEYCDLRLAEVYAQVEFEKAEGRNRRPESDQGAE